MVRRPGLNIAMYLHCLSCYFRFLKFYIIKASKKSEIGDIFLNYYCKVSLLLAHLLLLLVLTVSIDTCIYIATLCAMENAVYFESYFGALGTGRCCHKYGVAR